jgi:hypothetical protein
MTDPRKILEDKSTRTPLTELENPMQVLDMLNYSYGAEVLQDPRAREACRIELNKTMKRRYK